MSNRITKADLATQAAMLTAYAQAAGILQDGDRLAVERGMSTHTLHIIPAGGSNRESYPGTKAFGSIGATAREAFHTLNVMQETTRATLDALGVEYTYPAAAIAAIRGER
ncbi:hypothetical protein D8M34_05925 [Microbacterium sp. HSID17254]|uniref:hypothetical protein n=1 Tax=Microbacterium sp. HSID17254 TaxID=2419509 RepID=UPI000F88CE18|nr:hypothetical protein [Microbacterium sp. HSID17254]RUQ07007.1 hypothetical protein D8M34_05925 [Microbacterium sp. HSID17254]